MAVVGLEPFGEVGEVPKFAERDTELEEAVLVEWKRAAAATPLGQALADGFHCEIVRGDGCHAAVGDPLQQALIATIEHGTGVLGGLVEIAIHA